MLAVKKILKVQRIVNNSISQDGTEKIITKFLQLNTTDCYFIHYTSTVNHWGLCPMQSGGAQAARGPAVLSYMLWSTSPLLRVAGEENIEGAGLSSEI